MQHHGQAIRPLIMLAALGMAALPRVGWSQTPYDGLNTPAAVLTPPNSGSAQFISGLNVGWTDSNYGNDLGQNNLTQIHSGNNYSDANFGPYRDILANLGGNVARLFVFEAGQGFIYDSQGKVVGVDRGFINNLEQRLGELAARGITTILVLTDPGPDEGFTSARTIGVPVYANDGSQPALADYYKPGTAPEYNMVNFGVGTLVDTLHNEGYDGDIFAYEAMNEYNILADHQTNGVYDESGDTSHNNSANDVHAVVSDILTRVRQSYSGYTTVSNVGFYGAVEGGAPYGVNDLGLSFFSLHWYNDDATTLPQTDSSALTTILGESGAGSSAGDLNGLTQGYASQAVQKGYAGYLPWWTGAYNATDYFSFITPNAGADPTSYEQTQPAYGTLQVFEGWLNSRGVIAPSHQP